MQNIKIMFRSARFLVGFALVMIVVLYAVCYPMFDQSDPKADRRENPLYHKADTLRQMLNDKDDLAIYAELDTLADEGDAEFQAVISEVRALMDAGGLTKALSGARQIKKSNPLYSEFADLRSDLGFDESIPADEAAARRELENLTAHHQAVMTIVQLVASADPDGAKRAIESSADKWIGTECAALAAAIGAGDAEAAKAEADALEENHLKTFEWVGKIGERLDAGGYGEAAEALAGIQKTTLIDKDDAPNEEFKLGTDIFSRDILLEMAYGARLSLQVGLTAGVIATTIGMILGLIAGFVGGLLDNIITAFTNIFIVIPSMIVLILISIAIGQIKEAWITGMVIGLTAWPWTARAVRAQTTSLRNRDHVNMARITGYGTAHIIVTEILPYIASYVVMAFILQVASGIMSEATLAILGLGDPTAISLGRMINWAMQYEAVRSGRWWQFIPVACSIAMITFGLYMMNSGMDQVFNPKIRS